MRSDRRGRGRLNTDDVSFRVQSAVNSAGGVGKKKRAPAILHLLIE